MSSFDHYLTSTSAAANNSAHVRTAQQEYFEELRVAVRKGDRTEERTAEFDDGKAALTKAVEIDARLIKEIRPKSTLPDTIKAYLFFTTVLPVDVLAVAFAAFILGITGKLSYGLMTVLVIVKLAVGIPVCYAVQKAFRNREKLDETIFVKGREAAYLQENIDSRLLNNTAALNAALLAACEKVAF